MKTNTIIAIISALILVGIIYLIIQSTRRAKIEKAATDSGVPPALSKAIANSSNPAQAARMLGIPADISASISNGVAV